MQASVGIVSLISAPQLGHVRVHSRTSDESIAMRAAHPSGGRPAASARPSPIQSQEIRRDVAAAGGPPPPGSPPVFPRERPILATRLEAPNPIRGALPETNSDRDPSWRLSKLKCAGRLNYFNSVMTAWALPLTRISVCVRPRGLNRTPLKLISATTLLPSGVVDLRAPVAS